MVFEEHFGSPWRGTIEKLYTSNGELKAVVYPENFSGCAYHRPILFWKILPKVWEAGHPCIEIAYASEDDREIKIDECIELPAKEGSLVMDRDIRFLRMKYSARALEVMREISEQTPLPEKTMLPKLIEQRDENGRLVSCMYADEDIYGYGWQESVLYWRLTEAAWEMEESYTAKIMYMPTNDMPVSKIVYDKIFDIETREGSVLMEREIAYALVCGIHGEDFHKFLEL